MLYCLNIDLYDDLLYLNSKKNKFLLQAGTFKEIEFLDLFTTDEGVYHYLDLIIDAAKMVNSDNHYFIARNIISHNKRLDDRFIKNKEIYEDNNIYTYRYIYGYKNSEKLYITLSNTKNIFSIENNERIFRCSDLSNLNIEKIASSTNKVHISALLPPESEMFSPLRVDYIIPIRMLI